jgi:hypothetical protein
MLSVNYREIIVIQEDRQLKKYQVGTYFINEKFPTDLKIQQDAKVITVPSVNTKKEIIGF